MANEAPNHDAQTETETETSIVDIRTRDLSEFEEGEAIRVHYRDADDEPHKCITGTVEMHYSDRKAMIETDDGRELIVDLSDVTEENIRDFETSETIGRGMFAETAYHPEKDGEDLREEILGDDEETDDDDDDDDDSWKQMSSEEAKREAGYENVDGVVYEKTDDEEETEECHEGTCDREATETLVCDVKGELGYCEECYEVVTPDDDELVDEYEPEPVVAGLKDEKPERNAGLPGDAVWVEQTCDECGRTGWTSEEAADDARGKFGEPRGLVCLTCDERGESDDVLTYEKKVNHCHEKTGQTTTEVRTKRHVGEVYREAEGLVGFRTEEHDGVFFLLDDGRVEYDSHEPRTGTYEVGENGSIDRGVAAEEAGR